MTIRNKLLILYFVFLMVMFITLPKDELQESFQFLIFMTALLSLILLGSINLFNRIIANKYIRRIIKICMYIVSALIFAIILLLSLLCDSGGMEIHSLEEERKAQINNIEDDRIYKTEHFMNYISASVPDCYIEKFQT